jgi:hypothetical protein
MDNVADVNTDKDMEMGTDMNMDIDIDMDIDGHGLPFFFCLGLFRLAFIFLTLYRNNLNKRLVSDSAKTSFGSSFV